MNDFVSKGNRFYFSIGIQPGKHNAFTTIIDSLIKIKISGIGIGTAITFHIHIYEKKKQIRKFLLLLFVERLYRFLVHPEPVQYGHIAFLPVQMPVLESLLRLLFQADLLQMP